MGCFLVPGNDSTMIAVGATDAPLGAPRGSNLKTMKPLRVCTAVVVAAMCFPLSAAAQPAADFYAGKQITLIVGAGVDPETTPKLYNSLLGTKFKIVTGYNSTAQIALAIERGEVFGIGDWSWSSLKKQRPDWIRDRKITLLLQSALRNDPELPNLPNALDFAKTESDRKVIELFFTQKTVARPIIAPPGLPAERNATLRAAFAALGNDHEFLADAEKSNLEVAPITGEAVDKVVALIASASPEVADRYAKAFAAPGQAP